MTDETSGRGNAASRSDTAVPVRTINIHQVKLKTRKQMERTIQRERLGWWHDVCPGEKMVLRDATASDLARCIRKEGDTRGPEAFLCELPANGSLISLDAIEHRITIAVPIDAHESERGLVWKAAGDPTPRPRHYVAPKSIPFQARVQPWMLECFGAEISADHLERNHRFFEEAAELVQGCGMTASEAHQLVDYVYGRPSGEKHQEIGGVMVTLAALCLAQGQDMHAAGETELARVWTKVEQIRAKQAAKPRHSPLPEHVRQFGQDIDAERTAAVRTLQHAGYTYAGGQQWKPPLGKPPVWTIYETDASRDVLAERRRHLEVEGWTHERDDDYNTAELALAAAAYALHAGGQKSAAGITWPQSWAMEWFKPTAARRNLVKAGALILAEIERIDRAAARAQTTGDK